LYQHSTLFSSEFLLCHLLIFICRLTRLVSNNCFARASKLCFTFMIFLTADSLEIRNCLPSWIRIWIPNPDLFTNPLTWLNPDPIWIRIWIPNPDPVTISTDLIECGPHPDLDPKHWKKLLPMGRQNVLDPCAALTYLLLVESYRYQVRNVGG
jgi:hypothetical protein